MLDSIPSRPQEVESLSTEIAGILSHFRSASGRHLFAFAGSDPYPTIVPIIRVIVRATLDPDRNHTVDITNRFAELGADARDASLDTTDLMNVCGRSVYATERHIGRAHPDVLRHDDWVRHWATINQIACRAAMFGHRRRSFSAPDAWKALLHDPTLPRVFGLRRADAIPLSISNDDLVRAASTRVDAGDQAVISTDRSGTILYWNRSATTLYGWDSVEVIGRNIVDVTPATQARNEAEAIMHRLLSGRPWSGAFTIRNKSGAPLRAYVTDIPVHRDRRVVGIVGLSGLE